MSSLGPQFRRASAVGTAAFAVLLPSSARADAAFPYQLTYEAAPGCPSEAVVRSDVLAHVHSSPAKGARVALRIEERGNGFRGELVATDDEGHQGHRSVEGAKCTDVAHALAFLAGLAIELGGRIESEDAEPTPPVAAPPPAPPPPPPPAASPPPSPPRPAPRAIALAITLLGELRGGMAKTARPAAQLAFDVEDARPRVFAPSGRVAFVASESELESPQGRASLRYLGARAEACPLVVGDRRIALRPCAAFEIGNVWAESHVANDPRDATQLWTSAEALLRLRWAVAGGLFLESSAAAVVPILRPRYFFEPDRVLYEVPAIVARGAFGLGYRF